MNRIILIGNGFDLAHGLKTSYKDFIDDFWRREVDLIKEKTNGASATRYEDDFLEISVKKNTLSFLLGHKNFKNFNDLLNALKDYNKYWQENVAFLNFRNSFLEYISEKRTLQKWVDIEDVYHTFLVKTARGEGVTYNGETYKYESVKELNNDFKAIEKALEEYLERVTENSIVEVEGMAEIFNSQLNLRDITAKGIESLVDVEYEKMEREVVLMGARDVPASIGMGLLQEESKAVVFRKKFNLGYYAKKYEVENLFNISKEERKLTLRKFAKYIVDRKSNNLSPKHTLFLNFNYTNLEEMYMQEGQEVIHIHGELDQKDKPIREQNSMIFGYGDELCDEYKELELMNNNEVLENVKSIKYLETDNYKQLISFIESEEYQVFVMGHSCGNSDRTLLNTLFEHENCVSIKVYYYGCLDDNDYTQIVRNISRNFNDKRALREKVVNKGDCERMPQWNDKRFK